MKSKIMLFVSILTLLSCAEKKKQTEDFKIDIKTDKISENNYKTDIETNFPDNTSFTISVSRDYKRKNSSVIYSATYYDEFSTLVKNGKINFNFTVDETKWQNEYIKHQKEYGNLDKTLTDVDFSSINDTIEINVLYTPMGEKNETNIELIGKDGENLKGDGLRKNGSFNVFDKTIKIYNKFKK